jgi:hypothetical protein
MLKPGEPGSIDWSFCGVSIVVVDVWLSLMKVGTSTVATSPFGSVRSQTLARRRDCPNLSLPTTVNNDIGLYISARYEQHVIISLSRYPANKSRLPSADNLTL